MHRQREKCQRGFSLAEVLVAVLILGIVITTSLAVFVERKKRLQQANEIVIAYQALANEAEHQRRKAYPALADGAFESDTLILAPLKPFATIVKVSPAPPHAKNVTLTIRWRNGQREAKLGIVRADTGPTETFW